MFYRMTPPEPMPQGPQEERRTAHVHLLHSHSFAPFLAPAQEIQPVQCEGIYEKHLQGICTDTENAIFWFFTTKLVKTGLDGKVLHAIDVAVHHGDLCFKQGKVYVAVNLGKFNDPKGNADSWIYVYTSEDLAFVDKHAVPELFYGAGGIGIAEDRFYVVGGLPDSIEENYVYEYDRSFRFQMKHTIQSGHTRLGIQTATFAEGKWWFGCYGEPKILLVTDSQFRLLGRYQYDCSLGITGLHGSRFLSAYGMCEKTRGCTGGVKIAITDNQEGLRTLPGKASKD